MGLEEDTETSTWELRGVFREEETPNALSVVFLYESRLEPEEEKAGISQSELREAPEKQHVPPANQHPWHTSVCMFIINPDTGSVKRELLFEFRHGLAYLREVHVLKELGVGSLN